MKGKINIVGLGPGKRECMTLDAINAVTESDVVVGYSSYLKFIEDLTENKEVISNGMRMEKERCELSLKYALSGKIVSLVSGGDAGIYGMAGIMFEILKEHNAELEVRVIPGVSSVNACASLLGSPLTHDFACISLSDLMTSWEVIKKRLVCAASADFVIALYNPKSFTRTEQINEAVNIIRGYREKSTPAGIVRNAYRNDEEIVITNLNDILSHDIDMSSTIIIGNSKSFIHNNRIITPRGYTL